MPDLVELMRTVEEQVASAGAEPFRRVAAERRRRARRRSRPTIVQWDSDLNGADDIPGLSPIPGSVTMFWSAETDLVERLANAYATGELESIREEFTQIAEEHSRREVVSVEDAVSSLLAAPSFFDLRYGGVQLAQNIWLDKGARLGSMTFAYNGGVLDEAAFRVVGYPNPDGGDETPPRPPGWVGPWPPWSPWAVLLVIRPPELSDIERRLVKAVPVTEREINLAPGGTVMATPGALVTIAVFITINTAVTTCCHNFRDRLAEVSLPADVLRNSGPARSAAELLDLRAKVFEEFGVQ